LRSLRSSPALSTSSSKARRNKHFPVSGGEGEPPETAEREHKDCGHNHRRCKDRETHGVAAGLLACPTHYVGSGEPAEIADRIDERDTARSGGAREEGRRNRPERSERRTDTDSDQRKRHEYDGLRADTCGEHKADRR